jgi:hypothetical protein
MRNRKFAILSQLLSVAALAQTNSEVCSSLLDRLITETQVANREKIVPSKGVSAGGKEWQDGSGKLKFTYKDGEVSLEGAKEPIKIKEKLTPAQLERFKEFTARYSFRFDANFDLNSNQLALKEGVNHARLHEAFYGRETRPLEAAREMESLVKRSTRLNPNIKVSIRNTQTTEKFLENVGTMAEQLDSVRSLHQKGQLGQAIKDYQDQKNQEEGARVLEQSLQREPSVDLEQVIQTTEAIQKGQNPDAVEFEIDFSHDEPLRVLIERSKQGKLKVTPRGKPGLTIKTLKQLVEWLQGGGFDQKSYDWRTYEEIDSQPF